MHLDLNFQISHRVKNYLYKSYREKEDIDFMSHNIFLKVLGFSE